MTSYTSLIEPQARNTPSAQLTTHNPGMKMLLGEDVRFEWKELPAKSDMVLALRAPDGTIAIEDARQIIASAEALGLKAHLLRDYSKRGMYRIQGSCEGERRGGLIIPQDFGADRIAGPVEVRNFDLRVSAETYHALIAPHQKPLAMSA